MNITSVHLDATNRCRVVAGPAGRTYYSTPQAVGLALLGLPPSLDEPATTTGITWTDYLATHGVALGTRGDRQIHLALLPPKQRTIQHTAPNDEGNGSTVPLTVTFPHVLAGLLLRRGAFERASLFLVNMARQAEWAVGSGAPVLVTFPYGNVHEVSGHICWGGVRTADIRTMKDLEDLFFNSGFNRDLWAATTVGHPGMRSAVRAAPGGVLPAPAAARYTIPVTQMVQYLMQTE